jgi:2-dehydropantoate 2-reductase
MRIAIMGCGAMGSIYAGLLANAGHDVLVVDRWRDHVETIARSGLRVEGASGDRIVRVRAYEEPPAETVDFVVIAVKSAQAGAAAKAATTLIGPQTLIVAIQNGLGSADDIAAHVDPARLIIGIAGGFGASLKGPGHAHHNGMQVIRLGAFANLDYASVERIVAEWSKAGFQAEASRDIAAMQWEKLICNVAYSGPCTLTGLTIGDAMDDPEIGPLSRAAATEAWEVARARGIAVAVEDPVAHVRAFAAKMPAAKPSLLLDHEAGRPGEIDFINGAVPREAAKVHLQAPVNETLTRLVRFKERSLLAR